jgi:hypothetical protein
MGRMTAWIMVTACVVAGCSGVAIRPISPDVERSAHEKDGGATGYVVYGPMIVVEVVEREVCVSKNDKGACAQTETRCAIGEPKVLPDLAKPFLVDIKSGFGKAGVDVTIVDGWRLGNVKDNSDNSAILGLVEKLAVPLMARAETGAASRRRDCRAPGLYRVEIEGTVVRLAPLVAY